VGRYVMAGPIAIGGMSSVHFGRLDGAQGYHRFVAIKRMLATSDSEAKAMLLDEARLASRIQHANVVQTLDVVEAGSEVFLVLEYVNGASLKQLLDTGRCPPKIACAIVAQALRGLHAAHEATGEDGKPLELVHRDISPHNILVGQDGVARVMDFGVARARGRMQGTREGQLKGKLAYLSPEQVHGDASRRSDIFAAGVVLWETLSGKRLFDAPSEAEVLSKVLLCRVPRLEECAPALSEVLERALERDSEARFPTALSMADALEACGVATVAECADWVHQCTADTAAAREQALTSLEKAIVASSEPRRLWTPRFIALVSASVVGLALVALATWRLLTPPPPSSAVSTPPAVLSTLPTAPETKVASPLSSPERPELAPPERLPPQGPRKTKQRTTKTKATTVPTEGEIAAPGESNPVDRCSPPFVIDRNGVKQFKVDCLRNDAERPLGQ
jgi:serine/threonine-protein kinase